MNKRRHQQRSFSGTMFGVILAALIVASGGVHYVYLKNRQIQVRREIDAVERNIEQRRLEIRTIEMRMDQGLHRLEIRSRLQEYGSVLQPTPASMREELEYNLPRPARSVALYPPRP